MMPFAPSSRFDRLAARTAVALCLLLPAGPAAGGDAMAGERTYRNLCAACHGADGRSYESYIPRFVDGERLAKDDAELMQSVRDGVGDRMPPWGAWLDDAQIADVIAFIRTLPSKASRAP